ncbi:hypothetical protein GXM_03374 [Nostoc sphaeroides CCNUC1]|uniref:Uncharacterized protein n=1 Tax=Nostoc sphaeroides CCNUC1 TaxID=2653204 RepID=A0A5P8VZM9_9NOSO|nr:hypothetical protein GXM_03374 [Nostoc sphaeroides CCNUC1]
MTVNIFVRLLSFLFNPRTQKWAEHFIFLELDLVAIQFS